jgi:hypothetical protein
VCDYSHDAVIRVYDEAENVIDTREHTGDFKDRLGIKRPKGGLAR